MNESDLRAMLPPERPMPARRRRQMKEALMTQIHQDIEAGGAAGGVGAVDGTGPPTVEPLSATGRRRGHRRRVRSGLLLAGVAAAATVVVIAATVFTSGSGGPPGPTDRGGTETPISAERALARTSEALVSGRAEYDVQFARPGDPVRGVVGYTITGDDRSIVTEWHEGGQVASEETRLVDGEPYQLVALGGDAGPRWYRFTDAEDRDVAANLPELEHDPQTVLDELQGAGPFEEVGTETVDDVEVRRLRATHPEATPPLGYPVRFAQGAVTGLELWVDETGMVRRIDATFAGQGGSSGSATITFSDIGEPITIQAPADAVDAPPGALG